MITQTPWIERKFEFNFPVGLFPVIIERLRGTLLQLESTVKNLPDEKLSFKKDNKWSVKEIVGHLYDLEELWNGRIDDFLGHKETLRAADMSNAKTGSANHISKSIDQLLNQFKIARNSLIDRVKDLDEKQPQLLPFIPACLLQCGWRIPCFLWPNMMIMSLLRSGC